MSASHRMALVDPSFLSRLAAADMMELSGAHHLSDPNSPSEPLSLSLAGLHSTNPTTTAPGGRAHIVDVLVDLRRTMEALDEARVRVANILNLPEPHPLHDPYYHDFVDIHSIARIRRKNRTMLDDAIAKCLVS